jgi:hypothetical protein
MGKTWRQDDESLPDAEQGWGECLPEFTASKWLKYL